MTERVVVYDRLYITRLVLWNQEFHISVTAFSRIDESRARSTQPCVCCTYFQLPSKCLSSTDNGFVMKKLDTQQIIVRLEKAAFVLAAENGNLARLVFGFPTNAPLQLSTFHVKEGGLIVSTSVRYY